MINDDYRAHSVWSRVRPRYVLHDYTLYAIIIVFVTRRILFVTSMQVPLPGGEGRGARRGSGGPRQRLLYPISIIGT